MANEKEIYVLGKKVSLLQPEQGFYTSLDSIMLAAACPAESADLCLDAGCGVGGALFCLLYRVSDIHVTGVELQEKYVSLAEKNIVLNGAQGKAEFINKDIRDVVQGMEYSFHHVMCNPPYLEAGQHLPSPDITKALAMGHQEKELHLDDWVKAGHRLLKSGGTLTMIHRADHIDCIVQALGKRFGGVEIIPLWPKAGVCAKRVIIRAKKDSKTPAKIYPGLVLHEQDGSYTKAADEILRDGKGLYL